MATLEEKFKAAAERVRNGSADKPVAMEDALKVYALYKQATIGDVEGSQPWAIQIEARSKWDAWAALKGMSKKEAMEGYIAEVEKQEKKRAS